MRRLLHEFWRLRTRTPSNFRLFRAKFDFSDTISSEIRSMREMVQVWTFMSDSFLFEPSSTKISILTRYMQSGNRKCPRKYEISGNLNVIFGLQLQALYLSYADVLYIILKVIARGTTFVLNIIPQIYHYNERKQKKTYASGVSSTDFS